MNDSHQQFQFSQRRELERLDRAHLADYQLDRLNQLLDRILPHNALYAAKCEALARPVRTWDEFRELPFTEKDELIAEHGARNRTYPVEHYTRFHRTSGTRGHPLVILDTAEDWQWWVATWQYVLDAADVTPQDRVLMAFSFGPFIGFWSAHDAVTGRGALSIPGGGMSTRARLDLLQSAQATVLCCTPSYALHMAEVAEEAGIHLAASHVRRIIVAGEPGGSIPAVRARIEKAFGALVIDHSGATEVGPWGYADTQRSGLHVVESEFYAEFFSVETGKPAGDGELAELVLTTLGRPGCPVLRYRTGDLVRPRWDRFPDNHFVLLEGGVLGRIDEMLIIRGVNIFPTSIEEILRGFPEIREYRLTARKQGAMDELTIEVEDPLQDPSRIARQLEVRLGLRVNVTTVPLGSLPRFEGKAKRFIDHRAASSEGEGKP